MPVLEELVRTADVAVVRSSCAGEPAEPEIESGYELVLVRRGTFRRETEGGVAVADATTVYVARPGQWQHVHHVDGGGDAAYLVAFSGALVADDAERLPLAPAHAPPVIELTVRRLARTHDGLAVDETAARLLARLAGATTMPPVTAARRAAADHVRELLAHEVESRTAAAPLIALASAVGYAPHHLSRVFSAVTGTTIARQRRALRVRVAIDRIERGDRDLAAVAADCGFADHSHLVRALRAELGLTPTQLRAALSA